MQAFTSTKAKFIRLKNPKTPLKRTAISNVIAPARENFGENNAIYPVKYS